jgi:hypothetical protein
MSIKGTLKYGLDIRNRSIDCACDGKKSENAVMCKECRIKFNEIMDRTYGVERFRAALRSRKRKKNNDQL